MNRVEALAKMIDHSLLHPTMTDEELETGCEIARKYQVASVCIKPYAVQQAVNWLKGSEVLVGTVVGFPHGSTTIQSKVAETRQACEEGALEIDMVVNVGKVLSKDWEYVLHEITTIATLTHKYQGAILKVIFENDFLPEDSFKIKLCELCATAGADFVKTSTGYGFIKGSSGTYSYQGATMHDLSLMRQYSPAHIQVKAAGGVRSLDDLLKVEALGVTRVGATATVAILEEAKSRFAEKS